MSVQTDSNYTQNIYSPGELAGWAAVVAASMANDSNDTLAPPTPVGTFNAQNGAYTPNTTGLFGNNNLVVWLLVAIAIIVVIFKR